MQRFFKGGLELELLSEIYEGAFPTHDTFLRGDPLTMGGGGLNNLWLGSQNFNTNF